MSLRILQFLSIVYVSQVINARFINDRQTYDKTHLIRFITGLSMVNYLFAMICSVYICMSMSLRIFSICIRIVYALSTKAFSCINFSLINHTFSLLNIT